MSIGLGSGPEDTTLQEFQIGGQRPDEEPVRWEVPQQHPRIVDARDEESEMEVERHERLA